MKLFHEVENKYYELLTYLVNTRKSFSSQELDGLVLSFFEGEIDYEVWEILFSKNEGEELIYRYNNNQYQSLIEKEIPIRNTLIENQAAKNLLQNKYMKCFLQMETINKLNVVLENTVEGWDESDVKIKRRNCPKQTLSDSECVDNIKIIRKAIAEERGIVYTNILQDGTIYKNACIFPVKAEYSYQNDLFRVSAYEPKEDRFIRIDISTMSEVAVIEKCMYGLSQKYNDFLAKNMKCVVLDVEPVNYIVERCFRLFSCYARKAKFNVDDNKYQLEIEYLRFDEGEIIRNILSFGESVIVKSPEDVRRSVYERVLKAYEIYLD